MFETAILRVIRQSRVIRRPTVIPRPAWGRGAPVATQSDARRLAGGWIETSRSFRLAVALLLSIAAVVTLRVPVAEASAADRFVESINEARSAHGLREVRVSHALRRSSIRYSKWMLRREHFGHLRAIRAPRRFPLRGEVLASTPRKHPSARDIVSRWLSSRSHRTVVLNPRFRFTGVGVARGRLGGLPTTVLTAHFAT